VHVLFWVSLLPQSLLLVCVARPEPVADRHLLAVRQLIGGTP
jgi:hypothetical protein